MKKLQTLEGLKAIQDVVDQLCAADPVRYNLLASLLPHLNPQTDSVGLLNPPAVALLNPINLVLGDFGTEDLIPLAQWAHDRDVRGVIGPHEVVEGFIESYAAVVGIRPRKRVEQMIYRCPQLIEPRRPAGDARFVEESDADTVVSFITEFYAEALPHEPFNPRKFRESYPKLVAQRRFMLWEDAGISRSLGALSGTTSKSRRIGPIHTPRSERGRGYGSAISAVLTRKILEKGLMPCLYADLSNPTSNKIYRAIGYVEASASLNAIYRLPGDE